MYYLEKSLPEGSRKFTSRVPKKEKSQHCHWIRLRLEGIQVLRTADILRIIRNSFQLCGKKELLIVSPSAPMKKEAATAPLWKVVVEQHPFKAARGEGLGARGKHVVAIPLCAFRALCSSISTLNLSISKCSASSS